MFRGRVQPALPLRQIAAEPAEFRREPARYRKFNFRRRLEYRSRGGGFIASCGGTAPAWSRS
jgi:hypothetical protein